MAMSTGFPPCPVLLFLPLLLFVPSSAVKDAELSLSCDMNSVCLSAPFPDVCKSSASLLSPYVATELPMVIRGMLGLSISAAKAASQKLTMTGVTGFGVGMSATACDKSMSATVKALEGAMKEVNRLRQPGVAEYVRRLENIQDRVDKAVTGSDRCLKVLGDVPSGFGPSKATMSSVEHTMKLSSNLLVFVKKLHQTVKH